MLSDSIFELLEDLKKTINEYNYAEDFRDEIVHAAAILNRIQYRLDRIEKDATMTVDDFKKIWYRIFDDIIALEGGIR